MFSIPIEVIIIINNVVLALGKAECRRCWHHHASPEQAHGLMFCPDAILYPERSQLPALGLFSVAPEGMQSVVGCFLPQHLKNWKAITAYMWLLNTLSTGYKLQFHRRPPPNTGVRPTLIRNPKHLITLTAEIKSLLQKQAIEVAHGPDQLNGFFSRYFLIPKKDGGIRPILDLRDLNVFLKRLPFHMLRVADVIRAVNRNDWFVTIDLRDAYYHIPIAAHHRRFLRFHVNGVTYQFRVLPFGLALAQRTFTKYVRVALEPLQRQGMLILPYLDDWLLCGQSQHQVQQLTRSLILHIEALGLKINYMKTCLIPAQTVQFIGMRLESCTMRATLTEARSQAIAKMVNRKANRQAPAICRLPPSSWNVGGSNTSGAAGNAVTPTSSTLAEFTTPISHDPKTCVGNSDSSMFSHSETLVPQRSSSQGCSLGSPPGKERSCNNRCWGAAWRHQKVRGLWHSAISTSVKGQKCPNKNRQYHSGVLYQPPGGDKISEPVKFGTKALEMGGYPSPLSESQVSSRSLQSNSGTLCLG